MKCRSARAYRNVFRGNYKDLAPTERGLALEMSELQRAQASVACVSALFRAHAGFL
jgi:hypothetical protein